MSSSTDGMGRAHLAHKRSSREDDGPPAFAPGSSARIKAVTVAAPVMTAASESAPVRSLFRSLEKRRVRYCHWKSNVRLAGTLAGSEDIDVLVDPAQAGLLQKAIADNGFKLTVTKTGSGHPAVFHALALDEARGALVDLHAYHQLVSGDSLVKSYHFPVEEALLAGVTRQSEVKVPDPSAELVLFLLRILLKHRSLIELLKVNRNFAKSCQELAWLVARSDVAKADATCRTWFPTLSVTVTEMIACVADPRLVLRRAWLGMRIDRDLQRLRRLGRVSALVARLGRIARSKALRSRRRHERCLLSGGAWISFTGPKGAGKSTLAGLVGKALGRHLDVLVVHAGRPPLTVLSAAARLILFPAARAIPSLSLKEREDPLRRDERRYSTVYVIHKLLVARDRRRLLTRVSRAVTTGTIVISDRCPSTNYTGFDGSAFDDVAVERASSKFQRWLMEKERLIYRNLPKPRLVIKLAVDLPIALQRDRQRVKRGGPAPQAIYRRWKWESEAEFDGTRVALVDGGGTLEKTLLHCVKEAWSVL